MTATSITTLERERLLAFVRGFLGHDEAEDVAQEAMLRAWQRRDSIEPDGLWPWLCRVAKNLAIDRLRSPFRRRASLDALACEPVAQDPADLASVQREARLLDSLKRAMAELPEKERVVFSLFYEKGLGIAEIGKTLGAPVGTVKSWLHRARERLRERLSAEDSGEWPPAAKPLEPRESL